LNGYWKQYHIEGRAALNNQEYYDCISAVHCMNALLPDEYRLEINSEKHKELTHNAKTIICQECGIEFDFTDIESIETLNSFIDYTISGNRHTKAWYCPTCNYKNKISSSQMVVTEKENPFFYKVIPEPPKIKPHIVQIALHEKMVEWWFNAKAEIDHQLAKLRTEYAAEGEYDDTEEDED
jgi:hypothetical protein